MPKVGLRTIKSAIAVFICIIFSYYLLNDPYPFLAIISALLCIQNDMQGSISTAVNRMLGTFIGGFLGLLIAAIFAWVGITCPSFIFYLLISVMMIPLINICLILNKRDSIYIAATVFFSILFLHDTEMTLISYAWFRIAETLLGIIVALTVNKFKMYAIPNPSQLFVSDLDGTLLNSKCELNEKTIKTINYQISRGLKFTVATARTPATCITLLKELNLNLPIICMNGSLIYDIKENKYINYIFLNPHIYVNLISIISRHTTSYFIYSINESKDNLTVYYENLNNKPIEIFYNERKELKRFICGSPENEDVISIVIIERSEIVEELYNELIASNLKNDVNIEKYVDIYNRGYSYIEIFDFFVSKKNAMFEIKKICGAAETIAFGDNENDISMLKAADYSFAMKNAPDNVKKVAGKVIGTNDSNAVADVIRGLTLK